MKKNGYMYYWITMLYSRNHHNILNNYISIKLWKMEKKTTWIQRRSCYKTIPKLFSFFQWSMFFLPCFHICCSQPPNIHDLTIPLDFSLKTSSAGYFIWMLMLCWVSLLCFPLLLWNSHIVRCYFFFFI